MGVISGLLFAGFVVVRIVVEVELQAGNVDRVGHVVCVGRLVVVIGDGVVAPAPGLLVGGWVAAV